MLIQYLGDGTLMPSEVIGADGMPALVKIIAPKQGLHFSGAASFTPTPIKLLALEVVHMLLTAQADAPEQDGSVFMPLVEPLLQVWRVWG